jgi:hypothetical protein
MKVNKKGADKANKQNMTRKAEVEAAVEEVETVETDTETAAEEVTEEVTEAAPAAPVATPVQEVIPEVSAKKHGKDWVKFACTREINPAPTVGHFNVGHELHITKMVIGGQYVLPPHVAIVLVDAGAGMIA